MAVQRDAVGLAQLRDHAVEVRVVGRPVPRGVQRQVAPPRRRRRGAGRPLRPGRIFDPGLHHEARRVVVARVQFPFDPHGRRRVRHHRRVNEHPVGGEPRRPERLHPHPPVQPHPGIPPARERFGLQPHRHHVLLAHGPQQVRNLRPEPAVPVRPLGHPRAVHPHRGPGHRPVETQPHPRGSVRPHKPRAVPERPVGRQPPRPGVVLRREGLCRRPVVRQPHAVPAGVVEVAGRHPIGRARVTDEEGPVVQGVAGGRHGAWRGQKASNNRVGAGGAARDVPAGG